MKDLKVNRRKFVSSFGLLGAAASFQPFSVFGKPAKKVEFADDRIMKCKPYLQAAQTDRMTIRWITNSNCYSWIEYGESPANLNLKAHTVVDGMVQAHNRVNDITLYNLKPGKKYYYQAVSKPSSFVKAKIQYGEIVKSDVYSFTTLSQTINEVDFLIYNDVHDRPETFAHLMKHDDGKKTDFVLLNGDMFDALVDGDNQIVKNFLNPVCDLFATHTPFIFVRGNHEDKGEYARQLPDYLNGREHKFYYSFQYGPMYGIVLDTGEGKEDDAPAHGGIIEFDPYRLEQQRWLEKEVQKEAFRKAKHKVVFAHIPPYYLTKEDLHGSVTCRDMFVSVLNKANIDLMICGHTHRYGIHPAVAGKHNFPIVIGGGPSDKNRTLTRVKADGKSLNLKMTDDSGKVVGTLKLPVS